jgi:hypothetical protein
MPLDELEKIIKEYDTALVAIVAQNLYKAILRGAEPEIFKYQDYLQGWAVSFNLPTDDAVRYIENFKNFNLSDFKGSISATTKEEVRQLVQDAVANGDGWGVLATEIKDTNPYIFSINR